MSGILEIPVYPNPVLLKTSVYVSKICDKFNNKINCNIVSCYSFIFYRSSCCCGGGSSSGCGGSGSSSSCGGSCSSSGCSSCSSRCGGGSCSSGGLNTEVFGSTEFGNNGFSGVTDVFAIPKLKISIKNVQSNGFSGVTDKMAIPN